MGTISFGAAILVEKSGTPEFLGSHHNSPSTSGKTSQNQDQPSPSSVLDAPFEDDSCETSDTGHPSAPTEEVARSLSWDDAQLELTLPSSSKLSNTSPKVDEEEENQWHSYVQSLLSAAALDNEKSSTIFTRFYSVDSPLDPSLLEKFLEQKEEEEAKSRERRSNLRLLFDCVNSALLDIDQTAYLGTYPWPGACSVSRKKARDGEPLGEVWPLVRDCFCSEEKLEVSDTDNGSVVVDTQVRRDIGGHGWAESMRSVVDEIGRDISGDLFEDLVGEALADFGIECLL